MNSERFNAAIAKIDEANSADPNREQFQGQEYPKEVLYSRRMTQWLARLMPDASEPLKLAAHGQHICRWTIPRESYPMDRASYLKWRAACQKMHAGKLAQIMREAGYDEQSIARVQSLVRKERMKLDAEAQLLEDVVCLVFLENYFADFSREHNEAKLIDIVRKTWRKMSDQGHAAALELPLDSQTSAIVAKALTPDD